MLFAVNVEDTVLYRQYDEAAKRLAAVIGKAAELGRAEQQHAYVKLCAMVVEGLQGPAGQRLIRTLTERQLNSAPRLDSDEIGDRG